MLLGRCTSNQWPVDSSVSVYHKPPWTDVFRKGATTVTFLLLSHSWIRVARSFLLGVKRKRTGVLLTGPKIPLSNKSKFLECGGRVQETRVEDDSSLSLNCPQSDYLRCLVLVLVGPLTQCSRLPGSCRASSCWRALWKYPFCFLAALSTCP